VSEGEPGRARARGCVRARWLTMVCAGVVLWLLYVGRLCGVCGCMVAWWRVDAW
jgi:hypothetical protein